MNEPEDNPCGLGAQHKEKVAVDVLARFSAVPNVEVSVF